jgi:integrase
MFSFVSDCSKLQAKQRQVRRRLLRLIPRCYGHVTVHGFRSTFATWAEECTDYPDGVREAALAHKYKSETTAAYQRGQKLEKRRVLMKDWAQFLEEANVILFGRVG